MRNVFYLLLLGVALATVAIVVRSGMLARKNPGRPINSAMREALNAQTPQYSAQDEALIQQTYPTARKLPSGLRIVTRSPGEGEAMPQLGNRVTCHYAGRLLDGTEFDSSYKRGTPFTFRMGLNQVIAGWEEGFGQMRKGQRCTLIVPHWLAYGDKGRPPTIPPKATLIFEVELLDFR